jgi:hypothetical protein
MVHSWRVGVTDGQSPPISSLADLGLRQCNDDGVVRVGVHAVTSAYRCGLGIHSREAPVIRDEFW